MCGLSVSRTLFFALLLLLLTADCSARRVVVTNTCDNIPSLPHKGPGCGVPPYIPESERAKFIREFGANNFSRGTLSIFENRYRPGLTFNFKLRRLPKPNLVLTAWLMWIDPRDKNKPQVFKIGADYVSPCAAFNAPFSSGLGREPNQFRYTSRTTARLTVRLNFNPTYPNEGALARMTYCFQKDIPGIQNTNLRQYPLKFAPGIKYSASSSAYLRRYDPNTGFEILGKDGRPIVVKSPTRALSVIVASHFDRATHGITPGRFMYDHYDLMVFPIDKVVLGKPSL